MNVAQEGDRMSTGVPLARLGVKEMEEAMKASSHYNAPLDKPNQGRGVAVGFRLQTGQQSSATINVNSNGTINLITGSVDIGGTRTAVAMQAAEVLGIRAEDVEPTVVDTDAIGYTAGHRRQPHRLRHGSGRHHRCGGRKTADVRPGSHDFGRCSRRTWSCRTASLFAPRTRTTA